MAHENTVWDKDGSLLVLFPFWDLEYCVRLSNTICPNLSPWSQQEYRTIQNVPVIRQIDHLLRVAGA